MKDISFKLHRKLPARFNVIIKIILCISFVNLIFVNSSFSQTSINTYYYIPPTSGCNGVWALQNFEAVCHSPYVVAANPDSCTDFRAGTIVGDTLFLPLCDFPCTLYVTTDSGGVCICGTFLTGINSNSLEEKLQLWSNIGEWHIKVDLKTISTLEIYNVIGKKIFEKNFFQEILLNKNNFQSGVLIFKLSNGKTSKVFKVIHSN